MDSLSPNKKRILYTGGSLAVATVMALFWYLAGKEAPRNPAPAPATKNVAANSARNKSGAPSWRPGTPAPVPVVPPADHLIPAEEADAEIDKILRSEKEIPAMARDLNGLVQKLNGEGQVNASRHLVNLTSDEDYGLIAGFIVDDKMNPDVMDVLFSDLMNRRRELQLPLFLNILKNPKHPQNQQVKNVMNILASQDFGTDYGAWDKWENEELEKIKKSE